MNGEPQPLDDLTRAHIERLMRREIAELTADLTALVKAAVAVERVERKSAIRELHDRIDRVHTKAIRALTDTLDRRKP